MKKPASAESDTRPARERILRAAMEAFMELGYTEASTLKIATRAQVSKRELYALFGNKQAMLAACMTDRAGRMQLPTELSQPRNRQELADMLSKLGATVLREVSHPGVMAVYRLAITEAQRAPEVAETLETARQMIRTAMQNILVQAQSAGLIGAGDPSEMSGRYLALLWGDLILSILLRIREAPGAAEIDQRVRSATEDFLRIYSGPQKKTRGGGAKDRSRARR